MTQDVGENGTIIFLSNIIGMQRSEYMALSMIQGTKLDLLYDPLQQMVDERRCLTLENVESCFSAQVSKFPKIFFFSQQLVKQSRQINHQINHRRQSSQKYI